MAICKFNIDNFEYNIESNLEAIFLTVPKTVFQASVSVLGGLSAIDTALSAKGADVSLGVLSSAGKTSKQILGISAAFYAGAVIGSGLMAANRATRCSAAELKEAVRSMGFSTWWVDDAITKNPDILRKH